MYKPSIYHELSAIVLSLIFYLTSTVFTLPPLLKQFETHCTKITLAPCRRSEPQSSKGEEKEERRPGGRTFTYVGIFYCRNQYKNFRVRSKVHAPALLSTALYLGKRSRSVHISPKIQNHPHHNTHRTPHLLLLTRTTIHFPLSMLGHNI